jgi:RNA polymerase sigma factor (sigma-70 family)
VELREQFNDIYNQHFNKVFRLCKGYFNGNEAMAKDALQEIFIKIWQNLNSFRNESSISTWIYRISVNTCLLQLRKPAAKKEIKIQDFPEVKTEEYNHEMEEQLQKMYGCINQLDEAHKLTILMVLEGLDYATIAEVIGTNEDTLRVKIHRIKKQLSNCVKL